MATSGKATLHGLFSLQEDATLATFLPALEALSAPSASSRLRAPVARGAAASAREFRPSLPDFTHYIAIEFPDLEHDAACYQYVNGWTEPVHALHVAMYQQVRPGARFFLTYEPAPQ